MRLHLLLPALICTSASLSPAADITGRVLSERRGVVGATVAAVPYETRHAVAWRETKGEPAPPPIVSVSTSADGRFKLTVPPTAPAFVVRATFGGLATKTVDGVFEKSDTEDLGEISLDSGEAVSGRVVDAAAKPVVGALVRLGRDGVPTVTNKEGLFRFEDIAGRGPQGFPVGPLVLSVHAAGFEVQAVAARFSGPPVTVKLKASTNRLRGLLKDSAGKPAVDAVVRVVAEPVTRWVRTDATGRFEIAGTPAKLGRLQALGKDGSALDVAVLPGVETTTFTLARTATLEGRVTEIENGKMVQGVKVTARASGQTLIARTGVDGRYRISSVPQGTYRVGFDEKRFVLVDRREVEIAAGETKTLDIGLTPAVSLVGRVSDEKGQPIAGARGTLAPGAESGFRALLRGMNRDEGNAFVSGLDGTFKATRLAPGTNQKLTVVHPEFERRVVPGVDLVQGVLKPLSLDVVLSPGYVLSGVVKDKEGKPVTGATVAVTRSVQMSGGRGGNIMTVNMSDARPQAETDFEGKFGFKGLSSGDYDVAVSKSGFTRSTQNGVKTGEGHTPIEVVLNPGAAISGRLVQPNGLTVTGYSVTARPASAAGSGTGMMMMGRGNNFAQVDPDGAFTLDGLIPGTAYDLSIFGQGEMRGDPKKKNVVAPAGDVDIEVAARGRIAGRVVDAVTGAPITDFEARYSPARAGGMQIVVRMGNNESDRRTAFSSAEGAFAFEDVPPGNWDVSVWAKTYQEARTAGIAVVPGETKTVDVKAARGLVIRGRVVDAKGGRPIQDAAVSARDGGNATPFMLDPFGTGGVMTDADGRFEITGQSPGSYQLTARHPQFSEGTARVVVDDKDGAVDIPLVGGGSIAGVVLSAQGGPLPGAEVSLQGGGDSGGIRMNGLGDAQGTLTDAAGRFRFEHLAAGRYKVSANMRTQTSAVVDVPLNAGDVREDLRLSLDAGATIRGVVRGLPENERTGVMVGAQGIDYFANTRTGSDGAFEFAGVPKGTMTLRATAGDMVFGSSHTAVKEVTIPEGQPEIQTEIVFEDGLSISGTVMRRGVPVAGARVSAFMSATGRSASARVDDSGAFKIVGLEAGRVNVIAFAETFSSQVSQVVELKSDTSIDLVIPTAKLAGMVSDTVSNLPLESTVELQKVVLTQGAAGGRMMVTTDSSGRFAFDDLEPVDYRITARRSGYESVTKNVKPTEAGEDLRLDLKRGSGLAVEARDAQMGFGLRSLFLRVQEGTTDAFVGNISLDGEGKGEIPGIPPGAYTVMAQASGYAPVRIPNVMAPTTVLRLAFTPGGAVEFRSTEEFLAGGPKSGQLLSFTGAPVGMGMNPGGPNSFRISRLTQRMENLAPGRYRLTLEGGIDKTFDITEGGVAVVTLP
jgi:uncharacterized GH25 family protein